MNADKPDAAQVEGEVIDLWVRKNGTTFYVRGTFRTHSLTGKGSTASAAKADWIKQAEYEANR